MIAPAKINLALVVGPPRADGRHELVTVYQALELSDEIDVEPANQTTVEGFDDTIVRGALAQLPGSWRVRIEKRIPVAAGLGGGSSDAAAALQLANGRLDRPLPAGELDALAARVGADVPFFLRQGPQLGTGDGTELEPLDLPLDYAVLLLLPAGEDKRSTADVYAAFDARDGAAGFAERAAVLRAALAGVERSRDFASLPPNDLAALAARRTRPSRGRVPSRRQRRRSGGVRPLRDAEDAERAREALRGLGEMWITRPAWYR